jgi:hypothetical protein
VRELFDRGRGAVGQPEALEPARRGRTGPALVHPVQQAEVGELLSDRHPGIEPAFLGHVSEPQPLLERDRPPVPQDVARVRLDEPEHGPHCSRLAGAVGSQEPEHRAARDRERAFSQRFDGAETLGDPLEAEHVLASLTACIVAQRCRGRIGASTDLMVGELRNPWGQAPCGGLAPVVRPYAAARRRPAAR